MKKLHKTSLATLIGAALVSSFATPVNAESNPFAMNELANGYMQTAAVDAKTAPVASPKTAPATTATPIVPAPVAKTAGSCAEGKCGEMMKHAAAAAPVAKTEEGKCGQGMCGAMMENGKMKAGMEAACGAMMKGKEGACGDMVNKPAAAAPATAPAAAHPVAPVATPAHPVAPVAKPVATAPVAKPVVPAKPAAAPAAKPAAAPARANANKVVEGQCAAVKEETHDASKQHEIDKKANAPWGNRKKIVNP